MVTITGTSAPESIIGTPLADSINPGGGDDTVYGKDGDDKVSLSSGNHLIYLGHGDDLVYAISSFGDSGAPYNNIIYGQTGNDTIRGPWDAAETIYGGSGNDRISQAGVNENDAVYYGNSGNDTLISSAYADATLVGGAGDDSIYGGGVDESGRGVYGSAYMMGGSGNDFLSGGDVASTMSGGDGQDTIVSGRARDIMTGGDDADIFAFVMVGQGLAYDDDGNEMTSYSITSSNKRPYGFDRIRDFEQGEDKIALAKWWTSFLPFDDFAYGDASGTRLGGEYSTVSDRTYVYNEDKSFFFALDGVDSLAASDFIFDYVI